MRVSGCNERGFQNGTHSLAKFYNPWGIAFNPIDHCLYISDTSNHCIRVVNEKGSDIHFDFKFAD